MGVTRAFSIVILFAEEGPPEMTDVNATDHSKTSVETNGQDLSRLVWWGNFITIMTLGVYRFWYKTDLRKWYWGHTLVGGQGFEYRGNAKEKFLGFLYALAVVVPIYFLGTLIGLFAGELLGNIISFFSLIVIGFLIQYGAFRSRRYRLTRTVWRGVRFDQTGSAWTYALKSAGWGFLTIITFGLTFPVMRRALEDYRITNTRFGNAEGQFMGKAKPLMKRWLVLWLGVLLLIGFAGFTIDLNGSQPTVLGALLSFIALAWPFLLWPWYRANEFRYFTSQTHIGPVSFESHFETKTYYKLFLKLAGIMLLILIPLGGITAQLIVIFAVSREQFLMVATGVIFYLVSFFIGSSLKELILNQGFWRQAAGRLTVHGLDAMQDVIGTGVKDEAATGEGLADALDFGGI
jgi:uncharacterized membrane protein YjgN (DUF898 family)